VIGEFRHEDGSLYVMIVNKDLARSSWCVPKLRGGLTVAEMVSPYSGEHVPFSGEQTWLAPGQGVLLKLH
jgi:hypothetical protein